MNGDPLFSSTLSAPRHTLPADKPSFKLAYEESSWSP